MRRSVVMPAAVRKLGAPVETKDRLVARLLPDDATTPWLPQIPCEMVGHSCVDIRLPPHEARAHSSSWCCSRCWAMATMRRNART
jgi:hypothetical protein